MVVLLEEDAFIFVPICSVAMNKNDRLTNKDDIEQG
jgi:hypothetical protein